MVLRKITHYMLIGNLGEACNMIHGKYFLKNNGKGTIFFQYDTNGSSKNLF